MRQRLTLEDPVYTVTELTSVLKQLVAARFRSVRVEGEVSNAKLYPSGHFYFTLKDQSAMVKAVVFSYHIKFPGTGIVKDGDTIICGGKLDVYEKRGEYQLIVSDLTVKDGRGDLYLQFLALKEKLLHAGLFDDARKKPLPVFPTRIGIVTSPVGAAIRDMLRIIYEKYPSMSVVIYPVKVQGDEAPMEICAGIEYLDSFEKVDVIIVGRGGGSLEDLSCFNAEKVALSICACATPIVSAVGHETDFTISDFVADLRAPTPTAAADIVVRNKREIEETIETLRERLLRSIRSRLEESKFAFYQVASDFREKRDFFTSQKLYVDDLLTDLAHNFSNYMRDVRKRLDTLSQRMADLNPENTLNRGYSITQKTRTGEIVISRNDVQESEPLTIHLAIGKIDALVTDRNP